MEKPRLIEYPTSHSGNEHLACSHAALPPCVPLDVADAMRRWSHPVVDLLHPLPHAELEFLYAPEGFLAVARCRRCGGRHETLMDFRFEDNVSQELMTEKLTDTRMATALQAIFDVWLPDHATCDIAPRAYHIPSDIVRQIDRRLARAARRLRAGREVLGMIDLLLEDGRILELPVCDLPENTPENGGLDRMMEIARLHLMERERRRAEGVEVRGAVFVGEAWAAVEDLVVGVDAALAQHPSVAPSRREFIKVCAITSSMGIAGFAEIHRPRGRFGEGRGAFARPELTVPIGKALLLDGLLATSTAY